MRPDQRLPGGDLVRILETMKKGRGTCLDNVLPSESSRYDSHEITTKLHEPQRRGWCERFQKLRTSRKRAGQEHREGKPRVTVVGIGKKRSAREVDTRVL